MAITVGKYHLFERERRGRSYFYYWYEVQGKRVQKACDHGCDDKRSAVAYLEQLLKADLTETKRKSSLSSITINDFAKDMFTECAPHLARWAAKGKILKRQTIIQHRRHLIGYLLPKFGKLTFNEITPTAVEDFLLEQRLSNSCRNTILYTLKLMRKERPEIALMFGTLFCVTVSAGLRSGEIRALHRDQISLVNSGLMIDRAVDDWGEIGPLKKATGDDPRSRAVIIPEITLKILERWLKRTSDCSNYPRLIFPYHGKCTSPGCQPIFFNLMFHYFFQFFYRPNLSWKIFIPFIIF